MTRKKFEQDRLCGGVGGDAMYTGELIDRLFENVEVAERKLLVQVTAPQVFADNEAFRTYMYEFGRTGQVGAA
jgi:hypothetical protein